MSDSYMFVAWWLGMQGSRFDATRPSHAKRFVDLPSVMDLLRAKTRLGCYLIAVETYPDIDVFTGTVVRPHDIRQTLGESCTHLEAQILQLNRFNVYYLLDHTSTCKTPCRC